ncbi:hypothetical protein INR49_021082 [Caranx melampygus]|nr:hypothetical protein INR49_021082 [Caranx melampygus]
MRIRYAPPQHARGVPAVVPTAVRGADSSQLGEENHPHIPGSSMKQRGGYEGWVGAGSTGALKEGGEETVVYVKHGLTLINGVSDGESSVSSNLLCAGSLETFLVPAPTCGRTRSVSPVVRSRWRGFLLGSFCK